MVETNLGISIMEQLLTGATPAGTPPPAVPFSNAFARIAIGDGNGIVPAVAATDTVLKATTNIFYLPMDSGFPQVSAAPPMVMKWQGTATGAQANWAWNEWGIDNGNNGNTPVTLFNHRGVALGTKTNGSTWTFQAAVTQT